MSETPSPRSIESPDSGSIRRIFGESPLIVAEDPAEDEVEEEDPIIDVGVVEFFPVVEEGYAADISDEEDVDVVNVRYPSPVPIQGVEPEYVDMEAVTLSPALSPMSAFLISHDPDVH